MFTTSMPYFEALDLLKSLWIIVRTTLIKTSFLRFRFEEIRFRGLFEFNVKLSLDKTREYTILFAQIYINKI